jgi:plastocyanin
MRRCFGWILPVSVGSVVLAGLFGCAQGMTPPDGGNDGGAENQVSMVSISFNPSTITIQQGETVRWVNNDIVPHTVTSGNPGDADAGSLFDSGTLLSGDSFEHTFTETGTFVYFCRVHPLMMRDATVVVE